MKHLTQAFTRRPFRTFVASLLSYLMLAGPLAPLALGSSRQSTLPPNARGQSGAAADTLKVAPAAAPLQAATPTLVVTKVDAFTDPESNGAEPGQTINYTVTIQNTGTVDATNVTMTDTVDANTTIVNGSVAATPLGINDSFNVLGNVRIQPNAAQGVLANDRDSNTGTTAGLVASGPNSGPANGQLTLNADGSFSYNPNPGFTGTDSFTYTVTDSGGRTDTATVTLTVANRIWFVQSGAPAGGDGRLTNPFNCLVGAGCFDPVANDAAGDVIFLFSGSYTGGLTLLNNQKFIGQGALATVAAITGLTVEPYSDPLPTTSGASPVITTSAAATNGINLAQGNLLRGFNVGATTGAKIFGNNFGTLTVGNNTTPDVSLGDAGQALSLTNGTFAATSGFSSVATTSSSAQGILLSQVAGAIGFGSTTTSGSTTQGILVQQSTADINFGNTSVTGGTDGISLQNNSAGTRTFGTLTRTGGTGAGFLHAVGGGATNVTGATSITNTGGTGISINASNANISFAATSVDKGANAGACVSITSNAGRTTTFSSLDLNSTNAAGVGLLSTTGGTINVTNAAGSEITTPQLIDINVAALNLNFTNLASTNGPASIPAIRIIGASGSLTSAATSIQNPGNFGFNIDGNSAAFNFGNTVVNGSAGTGVFLNNNTGAITFADLDINPDANQPALHATNNMQTLTVTSGDIVANGSVALDIAGANAGSRTPLSLSLTRIASSNSASASGGVNLNFVSGNLSVSNPAGVDTDIQNPNGFGVRVQNAASGTLNFGDTTVNASGGTGIVLGTASNGNSSNFTFGVLNITPDTGQRALHAVQNTGTLTTTSGAISTTNAIAIDIAGTAAATRTPLNVQLTSVSALASGGNPANGIALTHTSATGSPGGFRVLGNGGTCTFATPTCTGGRIQSTTGAEDATPEDNAGIGVRLFNVEKVFLTRMRIDNHANFAIHGTNVVGFNLDSSVIDGTNGNNAAFEEGAIGLRDLTGTTGAGTASSISNSFIGGGHEFVIDLRNFNGGTLDRLTINNNIIGDLDGAGAGFGVHPSGGDDALHLEGFGSNATFNVTVTGNTLNSGRGDVANFNVGTAGNNPINSNFVFRTNTVHNTHPAVLSGGGGLTVTMGGGATVNSTYDISCNSFRGARGTALLIAKTLGSGTAQGTVFNNRFGIDGTPGSSSTEASGINIDTRGAGTHTVLVKNNQVHEWGANGAIQLFNNQGSAVMNATIIGNLSNNPHPNNALAGLYAESGALSGDTSILNLKVGGAGAEENNFVEGDPFNGNDVLLSRIAGSGTQLNLSRGVSAASTVQQIITDNNVDPVTAAGAGTITFVNTTPALPPAISESCTPPTGAETFEDSETVAPGGLGSEADADAPTTQPVVTSNNVTSQPFVSPMRRTTTTTTAAAPTRTTATRTQTTATQTTETTTTRRTELPAPKPPVINGDTITFNLGTIPAGESITVTFQVTIDNPFTSATPQVSNQATVTADGGVSVLSDDPDVAGANNPTVTPINAPPDIFVRDAKVAEIASGSTNMLFTVTLSKPSASTVSVNYTTADDTGGTNPATGGTCAGGADYETTSGSVSFDPGQLVKTVSVPVCADATNPEPDETFLLQLSNATNGNISRAQAVGTITANNEPGTILISEFRTLGAGPSTDQNDWFVEIYNNSDAPVTVAASDASGGWGLFKTAPAPLGSFCPGTPILVGTIPAGTVIPARGHYLFVGSAYSLGASAAGDQTVSDVLGQEVNLGLFNTADVANISSVTRLDAVGSGANVGDNCDLLREGGNVAAINQNLTSLGQHSFFRKLCDFVQGVGCSTPGLPKDTNDNVSDFLFADTNGTAAGPPQRLGAPGPEGLASPIKRDASFSSSLLDGSKPSSQPPNRVRDLTSDPANNSQFGTLSIRRRYTNNTGGNVTRLRFRVVETTSFPVPPGTADLRARTSTSVSVSGITDGGTCGAQPQPCTVTVEGTTLEQPPTQPNGGGINSTLAAGTVTLATPLANGASINVQFLLGVQQTGTFRFLVIIEALP
jgi:uncharacterized repeat protein (TIGR01451 family)